MSHVRGTPATAKRSQASRRLSGATTWPRAREQMGATRSDRPNAPIGPTTCPVSASVSGAEPRSTTSMIRECGVWARRATSGRISGSCRDFLRGCRARRPALTQVTPNIPDRRRATQQKEFRPTGPTASKRVSSPPVRDLLLGVGRHRAPNRNSKPRSDSRSRADRRAGTLRTAGLSG
jgi:hypothetical protein